MFAIQYLDHDEGSAARWNNVSIGHFNSRDEARIKLRAMRAQDDEWCSYSYRITEVNSEFYYSQPTDAAEW